MATARAIFENIPSAVSKFRSDGSIPDFGNDTLVKPFKGGQCLVFQVIFPDKTEWAVRIPIYLPVESAIQATAEENRALRLLEESGFPWSPRFVGEELNCENPVRSPFTVYKWIPGERLHWNEAFPSDRGDRDKVIKQLAHILVSLILCTGKHEQGQERLFDHLTRIVDNRIVRICRGHLPGFRVKDCFYHRNILPQVVDSELDDAPYFVGHGDLAAQNIIVDRHLNITGIIDWSFGGYEHFQLAATFPRIFRDNVAINHNVRGQDRRSFMKALQDESDSWNRDITHKLIMMYSWPDLNHRQQVLEAVVSKGAFLALAETFSREATIDIDLETEQFLNRKVGQRSGLSKEDARKNL